MTFCGLLALFLWHIIKVHFVQQTFWAGLGGSICGIVKPEVYDVTCLFVSRTENLCGTSHFYQTGPDQLCQVSDLSGD